MASMSSNGNNGAKRWLWRGVYLLTILAFFLPPYTSKGVISGPDTPRFLSEAFSNYAPPTWLGPVFQGSFLLLLFLIWRLGTSVGRAANGYFALVYIWLSLAPNIQQMEKYGLVILTSHLVTVGIVALLWIIDTIEAKNQWSLKRVSLWRYWVVPLAALAFFYPAGPSGEPSFAVQSLLYGYGIQYCPTTPAVLALLTFIYPKVNRPLFVVLSLTGVIYGLLNLSAPFWMSGYTRWFAFLHIPLLAISLYGLVLVFAVRSGEAN